MAQRKSKEKGIDLTVSCYKIPYSYKKFNKAKSQHKNATKMFDYMDSGTDLGRSDGVTKVTQMELVAG